MKSFSLNSAAFVVMARSLVAAFALLVLATSLPAWAMPFTVTVKPIQICDNSGFNCGNSAQTLFEAEGDKIWAQAGIDLTFLSWAQINNSNYLDIDIGNAAVIATEAQNVMTDGAAINDPAVTLAINMFFAPTLDGSASLYGVGCGGSVFATFCNSQVGVFIADNVFSFNSGIGRLDTIAHEIGHVLNLVHTTVANQLMATGASRSIPGSINDIFPDGAMLDQLTATQITTALSSPFVTDTVQVPEPALLSLLALALGLMGAMTAPRRRKD